MFLPVNGIGTGDRVRTKIHIHTMKSLFDKGHEFIAVERGVHGLNLVDDEGWEVTGVPVQMLEKVKYRE